MSADALPGQGGRDVIKTRAENIIRYRPIGLAPEAVAARVAFAVVEKIVEALRAHPLGEPAHVPPIRADDWAANYIEREFGREEAGDAR